jgi:hypothetical protein
LRPPLLGLPVERGFDGEEVVSTVKLKEAGEVEGLGRAEEGLEPPVDFLCCGESGEDGFG